MGFFSSALGKQKAEKGEKKANRQLYRHFLSVGRGLYPTTTSWGDAFKLETSLFSFKVNTKRLSTVKMYVTTGQVKQRHITARLKPLQC